VANKTGVTVVDGDGQVLDAGWTRGVEQTIDWADIASGDGDAVMFADGYADADGIGQRSPTPLRLSG
jgi:hypothetical protein